MMICSSYLSINIMNTTTTTTTTTTMMMMNLMASFREEGPTLSLFEGDDG